MANGAMAISASKAAARLQATWPEGCAKEFILQQASSGLDETNGAVSIDLGRRKADVLRRTIGDRE
jgi:hypothetical protein